MTTSRTGGQILVDQLITHGVQQLFCVPGESFLAVLDALHDASFLWGDDLAQPDSARLTQLIGLVARQFTVPKA